MCVEMGYVCVCVCVCVCLLETAVRAVPTRTLCVYVYAYVYVGVCTYRIVRTDVPTGPLWLVGLCDEETANGQRHNGGLTLTLALNPNSKS